MCECVCVFVFVFVVVVGVGVVFVSWEPSTVMSDPGFIGIQLTRRFGNVLKKAIDTMEFTLVWLVETLDVVADIVFYHANLVVTDIISANVDLR